MNQNGEEKISVYSFAPKCRKEIRLMKKAVVFTLLSLLGIGAYSAASPQASSLVAAKKYAYLTDFNNVDDYRKAGSDLNAEICGEGMVLLKNASIGKNQNILPLSNVKKISIFGKNSVDLQYGGGGSGSGRNNGEEEITLQKSLEKAGYEVNPSLIDFYKDNNRSGKGKTNGNTNWTAVSQATVGETAVNLYDESLKATFDQYNDAAVVLIARGGTEGVDCKTYDARDHADDPISTKHYLELSQNENDMLDMVEAKFSKVIVLINSGNIFQCDRLATDDKIQGVIWMGTPGIHGAIAVGRILNGTVNPSGRTVDTWTRNFRKDPVYQNWADNSQTNIIDGVAYPQDTMFNADGTPVNSYMDAVWKDEEHKVVKGMINGVRPGSYVTYEEDVYMDYRYYETRYADMEAKEEGSGDTWYEGEEGVIYPFGYGLSYTTFTQSIVSTSPTLNEKAVLTDKDEEVTVNVKVENTGKVAGKDVVEVYWKAPYTAGGIEKPYEILAGFGKSKLLEPGETDIVKVSFHLQDLASYDYKDANKNGFKGYELDSGNYSISINKNAHETYQAVNFKIQDGGIKYQNDRFTGHKVENHFSEDNVFGSLPGEKDVGYHLMSRSDFLKTFPTHPTMESRTLKEGSKVQEYLTHPFTMADIDVLHNGYLPEEAYKSHDDIPANWKQVPTGKELAKENRIQLIEMRGLAKDDPKWDDFLNQFTFKELQKFVEDGRFHSPALDAIGKPQTTDSDGPSQYQLIWWCGAPTVAATYNTELARRQGEMIGTEAHLSFMTTMTWGNMSFSFKTAPKFGWLGPAVNTHRSPFGGRNFEYYSAEPLISGLMGANVVKAATEKGLYCYFKHFAVNDQEGGREGASVYVSEQALREIYLKPFQMVVEQGKSVGIMSSYNRLGNQETAASYPLLTQVLREEWGFQGAVISDMTHHRHTDFDRRKYECINNRTIAGDNMQLDNYTFDDDMECVWDDNANGGKGAPVFDYVPEGSPEGTAPTKVESYTWWYAVRTRTHETLYAYANSGGMDQEIALLTNAIDLIGAKDGVVELTAGEDADIPLQVDSALRVGRMFDSTHRIIGAETYLDPLTALPDGLTLNEEGKIVGKPTAEGTFQVKVLCKVTLQDENGAVTTQLLGRAFTFHVVKAEEVTPDTTKDDIEAAKAEAEKAKAEAEEAKNKIGDLEKEIADLKSKEEKGGCGGSVVAATSVVGALALLATGLALKKKREEKNA